MNNVHRTYRKKFALLILGLLLLAATIPAMALEGMPLSVHFVDVGQGDSILIQGPDGATALIDGGNSNGEALAYLQRLGISQLDIVLLTHPHADHVGGLVAVMDALPVGGVWTSGAYNTTGIFERFLDVIEKEKIPYHEVKTGDTIYLGRLQLEVLYSEPEGRSLNDTSIVLRVAYGQVVFLLMGDAETSTETKLLQIKPTQLRATVLKVGHHGSSTSSSTAFLDAVRPTIAVYSAGARNQYGHPHDSVISQLKAIGATVYGTDVDGSILVTTDGMVYEVETNKGAILSIAPPVSATLPYDPAGADRDCGNFKTHAEAQAFFIAAGGPAHDPHRLDGDNDGIACESLP